MDTEAVYLTELGGAIHHHPKQRLITIVVADDHERVRQMVKQLLEEEPDFTVLGEASNGTQAIEITAKLKPNILVSDLIMPSANGIDVAREVGTRSPETKTVILSMYHNSGYVERALEAGVRGYVLKGNGIDSITKGIRQVLSGECYLDSSLEMVNRPQ
jgi:DNA-binding NarL/FixJ family response regulator